MIEVFDNVLVDPMAYRAAALALPRHSVPVGPATFHGIAPAIDATLSRWVEMQYPGRETTLSFFRLGQRDQVEPNFIHTDRDMGDWTAILYLTPDPPAEDGTTFWRHRSTGETRSTANGDALLSEWLAWRDLSQWEIVERVPAQFNRAVVFPADRFHSRSIPENYGIGDAARLIQIAFGKGA